MTSYKEVESVIWRNIRMGQCFTVPVPVRDNDQLSLVSLVYAIDARTHAATKPLARLSISAETLEASIASLEPLEEIDFTSTGPGDKDARKQSLLDARRLFDSMLIEAENGERKGASGAYAEAVWRATQPSLRPYLVSFAPVLFKGAQL